MNRIKIYSILCAFVVKQGQIPHNSSLLQTAVKISLTSSECDYTIELQECGSRLKPKGLRRGLRGLNTMSDTQKTHHQIWEGWAARLQQLGLREFLASFLEASGPVNLIGAQLVYLGQPVLGGIFPNEHLNALASLLEESDQTQAFVALLREEGSL